MRWLPIILVIALLFYGCVEERQVSITGYEQIESISGMDTTGDGINDVHIYTYSAKPVNEEVGIYMKKTVAAYPVSYTPKITSVPPLTSTDLQYVKDRVAEFRDLKNQGESACISRLSLNTAKCLDAGTCIAECKSATCEKAVEYNEESFGFEIYQFNYNSGAMNQLITEVEAANEVNDQGQRDALAGKLANILSLSGKLSGNLLFRSEVFGACARPTYDGAKISDALARLGYGELEQGSYEYKVAILLDGGKEGEFIELYVKDSPPIGMAVEQFSLDILGNGKLYEKEPLTVGWDGIEVNAPHRFVYYDFVSTNEPTEEMLSKWRYPRITERNLAAITYINQLYTHPVGQFFFAVSAGVFGISYFMGYYAAVGAAAAFWVVMLFLLLLLLEIAYRSARAAMDKKNLKEVLMDAFGAPMADWKIYVAVGLALVLGAVLMNMFYTAPVETNTFEVESLILTLGSDVAGAAVVILFVIGVYTLFLVFEDFLKGLMLGKDYYELKGATKEENLKELATLRETWQALRMRVEDLSKTGMVVTEEYAIIVSVPIERLEQMIASDKQGMAKQLIRFNQERLEMLDKKLDEKVNVMNEKWPEWNEELKSVLASSDNVPLNTLLFIPLQWREWAVEKYISENRNKGYVIEGGAIVRREVKVDELLVKRLKEMLKKETIKQAVLISKEVEVYNSFQKGKKTAVSVLFLKLKAYVAALAKKMGATEVKRFVVSGEKNAGVYLGYNNHQAFIISEKSKIREVVEEWNSMVEKLA